MYKKSHTQIDVYQTITDQIIDAIENHAQNWQMPWHRRSFGMPINAVSKKSYNGINILSLWAASSHKAFTSNIWGTYQQWQQLGCQVRGGEKSSPIIFYKQIENKQEEPLANADQESDLRWFGRKSSVFNAEQVEGYQAPAQGPVALINSVEACKNADDFIAATKANIRHGGDRAFYRSSGDYIQMPLQEQFIGSDTSNPTEAYYGTLLHELTHWTGNAKRCDRALGNRFGSNAYAMEELIAEIGAAFLCVDLQITSEPRADHAAYLKSWLKILKSDKRAIFVAAAKAGQAHAYLQGLQDQQQAIAA